MNEHRDATAWEYCFAWTGPSSGVDRITKFDGPGTVMLPDSVETVVAVRLLGASGWELVSVDRTPFERLQENGGTHFGRPLLESTGLYIFKRAM